MTHQRRRIEWPTRDLSYLKRLHDYDSDAVPATIKNAAKDLVHKEYSNCGGGRDEQRYYRRCYHELTGVAIANGRPVNYGALLVALCYRGRQQSAVWQIYEELIQKGLIDPIGLLTHTDFTREPETVNSVAWRLACFEYVCRKRATDSSNPPFQLWSGPFLQPIFWLATTIVRGGHNIDKIFETVETSGFFGQLNKKAVDHYNKRCKKREFKPDATARAGEPGLRGPFGFWLPHGVKQRDRTEDTWLAAHSDYLMRFDNIEKLFKDFHDISDEEIGLE